MGKNGWCRGQFEEAHGHGRCGLAKICHKVHVPSTPGCAPKVGISVGTVRESLLRKNTS